MMKVEIMPIQESLVLRARGSELLILPQHIKELQGKKEPKAFTHYFTDEALVNRPARKLFEAWLRKDETLWPRLFKTVHEGMDAPAPADGPALPTAAKTSAQPPGHEKVKTAAKIVAPTKAAPVAKAKTNTQSRSKGKG